MSSRRFVACIALWTAVAATAHAQWPQFRGPNGSGVDAATGYPTAFSPTHNVVWKAAVPYAQSSPVIAGDRIYLTASEGGRLLTIALDAGTGREAWRRAVEPARVHKIYKANDPASPTPAVDPDGVIVFFADFGLAAYTRDGKERWTVPLGPFKSFYGMGGSPIVAGDAVVLVCDQASGSFIIAVDRRTGQPLWRKDRPGTVDAYSTPMLFQPPGGAMQVIVLGTSRLEAYAPDSGEQRWWMPLGSSGAMGTAVGSGDTLFVATLGTDEPFMPPFAAAAEKYDKDKDGRISQQEFSVEKDWAEHFGFLDLSGDGFLTAQEWNEMRELGRGEYGAIAIRPADLKGKVEPSSVLWRFKKNLPYIPAPLVYQNVFYMVKDGGIVTSLDAATGRPLKEGRAEQAIGEYHASPVAADGKLFLANVDGKITVLKAAGAWEVLGVNDLGEEIHATPALSAGRIFVRTRSALYCFGAK